MRCKKLSWFLLLTIVLSIFAAFLPEDRAFADYPYLRYIPTSNCVEADVYGASRRAQTFLVDNCSISVTNVSLFLFRTGLPGNLVVSLKAVDSSGKPTGSVLSSGVVNGNGITSSPVGANISFQMSPGCVLNKNTNYSIVVSAIGGDSSNYLNILCNDSLLYTNGNFENSSDGGATWTKNVSRSALFVINGNPFSISISDAKVFKNIFEPDDRLFVINYNVSYSMNPKEAPGTLFNAVLLGFAARPLLAYNSSIISIYLSAQNATVWRDPETIWISGNSIYFVNGVLRAAFSIDDYCYVDSISMQDGRAGLWSYLLTSADLIGPANNMSYTFSSIYYGSVLNTDGCVLMESAIPGLGTIIPLVGFYLSKVSTEGSYFNYTQAPTNTSYADSLWLGQLGNSTNSAFTGLGIYLSAPAGFLKGLFCLFFYAIVASIIFLVSGDSVSSLILAFPIICYGVMVGLIPMALLFVFAFFMAAAMAYYIWLH
jgi:hypothetical protein